MIKGLNYTENNIWIILASSISTITDDISAHSCVTFSLSPVCCHSCMIQRLLVHHIFELDCREVGREHARYVSLQFHTPNEVCLYMMIHGIKYNFGLFFLLIQARAWSQLTHHTTHFHRLWVNVRWASADWTHNAQSWYFLCFRKKLFLQQWPVCSRALAEKLWVFQTHRCNWHESMSPRSSRTVVFFSSNCVLTLSLLLIGLNRHFILNSNNSHKHTWLMLLCGKNSP